MRIRAVITLAIFFAAAPASGEELPGEVLGMTATEYNELNLFVRATTMQPVADSAGIPYYKLNACLMAAGQDPVLRRKHMSAIVPACVEWARSEVEKAD